MCPDEYSERQFGIHPPKAYAEVLSEDEGSLCHSFDYDKGDEIARLFFKTRQAKMRYADHRHAASGIIFEGAENM